MMVDFMNPSTDLLAGMDAGRNEMRPQIEALESENEELRTSLAAADRLAEAMIQHMDAQAKMKATQWSADDPAYLSLIDIEADAQVALYEAEHNFITAYTQTRKEQP